MQYSSCSRVASLENMGKAQVISLLSRVRWFVYALSVNYHHVDSPLTVTSDSIRTHTVVLPDPNNMGILEFRWFLVKDLRNTLFLIRPVNYCHPWVSTYPDVRQYSNSLSVFCGREILGIAVGFLLLSCWSAEICVAEYLKTSSWISDFRYLLTAIYYKYNTNGPSVCEYFKVALGIVFLKIYCVYKLFTSSLLITSTGFEPS